MGVFSGVVAANIDVVMGIVEKLGGDVISLSLVMSERRNEMGRGLAQRSVIVFGRRPTAKGVGLHVADSYAGNHPEDGFTPLKPIRRLLVVIGRRSHSGFEGEAFKPDRRGRHQPLLLFFSSEIDFYGLGSIRHIQGIGYSLLEFLRVGTTFDIFQNIHILYLEYDVLIFSGYGVLRLFPLWSLVSEGTDTPYLP
ncbi:hypothetical protein Tco_0085022 [Tanacetum coccineum]